MTEVQILQEELENAYRERLKANAIINGTIDNLLKEAKHHIQLNLEGFWKNGVYYLLRGVTTRKSTECGRVDATISIVGRMDFSMFTTPKNLTELEKDLLEKIKNNEDYQTLIQLGWRLESLKHKIHAVEDVRICLNMDDLLNEDFLLLISRKVQSKCKL